MKRLPPKHDYAMQVRLQELWERFEYPDLPTQIPFELGLGGGGAPTVVVAASDASDLSKQKADVICTGFNDDQALNAALARLNTGFVGNGGRMLLTEGTFNVRASWLFLNDRVNIQGLGASTVLDCTDSSGTVVSLGPRSTISDLMIDGAGGGLRGVFTASNAVVARVRFNDVHTAIGGLHTSSQVVGCISENTVTTFVQSTVGGVGVVVASNKGWGVYDLGLTSGLQGAQVVGNYIGPAGGVSGGNIRHVTIADNYIEGDIDLQTLQTGSDCTIQGNTINGGAVLIENKSNMDISDNLIWRSPGHGISLTGCDRMVVGGNYIVTPSFGGTNTSDGVFLAGDSNDNYIHGNYIEGVGTSWVARYGINVSASTCDCNIVVGNRLGPVADYGTDALNDAGTDTQLFYPADATYGDNFTDCATSPTSP